jgi:hypothetical protein
MLTTNMLLIVKDDFKRRSREKPASACALSARLFSSLVTYLEVYEEYEDVIEGVYEVLQAFV